LVGKLEGKRPLVRPKLKCEENVGIYFREMGWEEVEWIQLASDSWSSGEHGTEPSGSMKAGEFFDQLSDCFLLNMDFAP
jgi:hypothetical protein